MEQTADVVIIGAGLPGLALSISLQERGISTLLIDARKSDQGAPRGLTLQPNGLEALERIGILDKAKQYGSQSKIFEIRNWSGNVLLEADYELLDHPHKYLLTVNSTELDLLFRYRAEQAGATVVWAGQFQDLLRSNGQVQGVEYETEKGRFRARAAVTVGADGSQSRVRASMGSKVESKEYEESFVAGLIGQVSGLYGRARQYQDPGKMLGLMPAGATSTYFFYCVGSRSFEDMKREGFEKFRQEIIQVAPEATEAFRSVAAWTKLGFFTPNYTHVDPWVSNGVALLGDSAHSFHPHAGQGLNLSLQDALVLAEVVEKCVKSGNCSMSALQEYQNRRKMFAEVIGQNADYSAKYALSNNWLIRRLNRRALRKLQKNKELLKKALELTAGVFEKKPSIILLARIGGILP